MTLSLQGQKLYTRAQVRELDRIAIQDYNISGYDLMCRAGRALLDTILSQLGPVQHMACCCGGGNNGGDGLVLARLCRENGILVSVFLLAKPEQLTGAARQAYDAYRQSGGECLPLDAASLQRCDVVVDALFGTGLDRDIEGEARRWIDAINASGAQVVSADIPSGLDADTGAILGCAVFAHLTVTFIGIKRGLLTGSGVDCTGQLSFDDLNVAPQLPADEPVVRGLTPIDIFSLLSPRPRSMHKGKAGHVLIVGGAPGYAGAMMLAGKAALRGGAGLVSIATHPDSAQAIAAHYPELMVHSIHQALSLDPLLALADGVLIGPGLGQSEWAKALLLTVLNSSKPLVIDADALNLMAAGCESEVPSVRIITPHPGEAARLADTTVLAVETDRFTCAKQLSQRYKAVVVLKGAGTLVSDTQQNLWLCNKGNPGMATAGMGDVLAGLIAALLAQGLTALQATRVGVCVHAMAGDEAAINGMRGLNASDLLPYIRKKVNPCR